MTKPAAVKTNRFLGAVRTRAVVTADENGELPTRIQLIKAGNWPNSVKGALKISKSDLQAMADNFAAGVGRGGNKQIGLPIDFSHNEWDEAAGWINGLVVDGSSLYADPVEWSTDGKAAILGGMFKCISPSFYPADRGGYTDPEDYDSEAIPNTVVGAGLTNIPFFKGLSAVKADSLSDDDDDDNMIFINQSVIAKEDKPAMTLILADVVAKDQKDLTQDEEKFLADHRTELTDEQKTKFNLVDAAAVDPAKPVDAAAPISAEDAKLLADIHAGTLKTVSTEDAVISASELASLKDTAEQYRKEKAEEVVASHIKRGAIKADASDRWVDRLLHASKADRVELEADLTALPSNELLASELGDDNAGTTATSAREELAQIAASKVAEAEKNGKTLKYDDALRMAVSENQDLTKQDHADQFGKVGA